MSLKELTWEHHKRAERQDFVKVLMSGEIDPRLYATFLYNQHPMYNLLEVLAMNHGLMNDIGEVRRAPTILEDYNELWEDKENTPELLPVTKEYMDHLMSIKDEPNKLMAHIYVRHMGELSGGQMIKRKIPGEGRFYQFENAKELKEKIRSMIDDSMADEAKLVFDFATQTFKELMEVKFND